MVAAQGERDVLHPAVCSVTISHRAGSITGTTPRPSDASTPGPSPKPTATPKCRKPKTEGRVPYCTQTGRSRQIGRFPSLAAVERMRASQRNRTGDIESNNSPAEVTSTCSDPGLVATGDSVPTLVVRLPLRTSTATSGAGPVARLPVLAMPPLAGASLPSTTTIAPVTTAAFAAPFAPVFRSSTGLLRSTVAGTVGSPVSAGPTLPVARGASLLALGAAGVPAVSAQSSSALPGLRVLGPTAPMTSPPPGRE